MPEKRSKRRVNVLELPLGSFSFSSRKGVGGAEYRKREIETPVPTQTSHIQEIPICTGYFLYFLKGFYVVLIK